MIWCLFCNHQALHCHLCSFQWLKVKMKITVHAEHRIGFSMHSVSMPATKYMYDSYFHVEKKNNRIEFETQHFFLDIQELITWIFPSEVPMTKTSSFSSRAIERTLPIVHVWSISILVCLFWSQISTVPPLQPKYTSSELVTIDRTSDRVASEPTMA